jgi:hypothetical protein
MFPLDIIDGLVYLRMRPFTDEEYAALPHVPFTSDVTWDATVLDCTISDNPNWHDNLNGGEYESHFDAQGNYLHRDRGETMDDIITTDVNYIAHSSHLDSILCCKSHTRPAKRDLEAYRKFFAFADVDTIHHTYNNTTQWARRFPQHGETICNTFKSPFPAYNDDRRNEPVSCDVITSTITAFGNNKNVVIFVGQDSKVISVHGIKLKSQFVNTFEDEIRRRGAMSKLISDNGAEIISQRVQDILRAYHIDDWQSEPKYQHQNPSERQWQHVKHAMHRALDASGAPRAMWFLAMEYVVFIL